MSDEHEKPMSGREKRGVILRTLKAVNAADRGFVLRDTLDYCISITDNFLLILLSALVIDGVTRAKPLSTLLTIAGAMSGARVLLAVIQRLLLLLLPNC